MNEFVFKRHSSQTKQGDYYASTSTWIRYSWIPASEWGPQVPTLVYFLGHDGLLPKVRQGSPFYNLLCIVDRSGPQRKGEWYFGRSGVPNTLNLVIEFIEELAGAKVLDQSNLIFAGRDIGAHAALYFHNKFRSPLSIVHNPTTNLMSDEIVNGTKQKLHSEIFGKVSTHDYQNLITLFEEKPHDSPVIVTYDVDEASHLYNRQIFPLDFFPNVELIKKSQMNFSGLFTTMHEILTPINHDRLQRNHYSHQQLEIDDLSFSLSLSSRQAYSFHNTFSFTVNPYNDRSWRFWLQNLTWMKPFLNTLDGENVTQYADFFFNKWIDCIQSPASSSEFFYHDHSLAYRATSLMDCFDLFSENTQKQVFDHLHDTAILLLSPLEDNSLSNHAFDQAISLFLLSEFFEGSSFSREWQRIALKRIERELKYSFTTDGVHVENSPSYHHGMILNIHRSLSKIVKSTKNNKIQEYVDKLSITIPYLAWIIRPDGKVPPIGDSEEKQVSTELAGKIDKKSISSPQEGMRVFGNGYAIWKSTSKRYHMTLKSCNHGRFHRHDDDCSLTLWVRGENLLMDSGLLYYQEKDPDRVHVRSASGHSGFEIPGKRAIRDPFSSASLRSNVKRIDDLKSQANMGMYGGLSASRTVFIDEQIVNIIDNFSEGCLSSGVQINFIIDGIWNREVEDNRIVFSSPKKKSWTMEFTGFSHEYTIKETFTSPMKHKKKPAIRLVLIPINPSTKVVIDIGGV